MAADAVPTIPLPGGGQIPVLGQGTWGMGEDPRRRSEEIRALREGLDLGLRLIDTAEMYADGEAERLVAEAVSGRRDSAYIVSKVLPSNSSRRDTIAACERSLRRLGTDRIDLYLLHWRGDPPLAETVEAFESLASAGKIRRWGVSNLDVSDLEELETLGDGTTPAVDQVLYNLTRRRIEHDLLPWCRERGIPIMAYSPLEQSRILGHPALRRVGSRHGATPAQTALAWVLAQDGVCAIPKSASAEHVRENFAALELRLEPEDFAAFDAAFPRPAEGGPLETL